MPWPTITARNFVSTDSFFEFHLHRSLILQHALTTAIFVHFEALTRLTLYTMADEALKDFLRKQARSLDSLLELTPAKNMFGEDVSVGFSLENNL